MTPEEEFALLRIALKPFAFLARALRLELHEVREMVFTSLLLEYQAGGSSWEQAARALGVSRGSIAALAKAARERGESSVIHHLRMQRKVLLALGHTRMTTDKLEAQFGNRSKSKRSDVERALDVLANAGLITESDGLWATAASVADFQGSDAPAKLSSFEHFMEAVGELVLHRFLKRDDSASHARIYSFDTTAEELMSLRDKTRAELESRVVQLDANAADGPDPVRASAAFFVVPRTRRE